MLLTVQKANTTACRFYDSIGATVNEDLASPGHKHEYREFLL